MRVFLTGASGWIGSVIARELLDIGHSLVGLVRSKEKGEALSAVGITPLIGGLGELDVIRGGVSDTDGIIHTAFGLDLSKIVEMAEEERLAIETFGEVYAGSNRPIIVTGGMLLTPPGEATRRTQLSTRVRADGVCACRSWPVRFRGPQPALSPWARGTTWLRPHASRRGLREGRLRVYRRRTEPLASRAPARFRARLLSRP